jgi:hypothetical protein
MDMGEIWLLAGITTAITIFATGFITLQILGAVGVPGLNVATRGGASNDDKIVKTMDDLGQLKDAKPWLDESKNRMLCDLSRPDTDELIDGIYQNSPKRVLIKPDGPQAVAVVVELPRDAKKRKAIFDLHKEFSSKHKKPVTDDTGQRFLMMRFGFFLEPEL